MYSTLQMVSYEYSYIVPNVQHDSEHNGSPKTTGPHTRASPIKTQTLPVIASSYREERAVQLVICSPQKDCCMAPTTREWALQELITVISRHLAPHDSSGK